MTILDEIRAHKEVEVAMRQTAWPLLEVQRACASAPAVRSMQDVLARPGIQIVAEVKRRSPAKGNLSLGADAPSLATRYAEAGAAGVSVLTDERFFSGSDADLTAVRAAIDIPILRKDFTISSYQIHEARSIGADVILLIVAMLSDTQLRSFLDSAASLHMEAIVEAHTEEEVRRAVALGAQMIGINNRNLATFEVDLGTTERLRPLITGPALVIGESGISTRADVVRLERAGADAVLIGEALVTAQDARAKIHELLGLDREPVGSSNAR